MLIVIGRSDFSIGHRAMLAIGNFIAMTITISFKNEGEGDKKKFKTK
jgi:hypothetical protein